MSVHRPVLTLVPGPRGVRAARHWVSEVCDELGRPELVESAQLGMSELVTNALLHASAPIEVRVRGTRAQPRLEVHDSSPEPPVMLAATSPELVRAHADVEEAGLVSAAAGRDSAVSPAGPVSPVSAEAAPAGIGLDVIDLDDVELELLTVGRGLGLVARASVAWGADLEPDGKTVWFVPAAELADEGPAGLLTGEPPADRLDETVDPVTVHLLDVPTPAWLALERHLRELRREVRLLAIGQESTHPQAGELAERFARFEQRLRESAGERVVRAAAAGHPVVDLEATLARGVALDLGGFGELLDLADDFCREERLLSMSPSREQRRFQRWLVGEFAQQAEGHEPTAWADAPQQLRPCGT